MLKLSNRKINTRNLSEAEISLKGWNIKYIKRPDGIIIVEGGLELMDKKLTKLPDLSNVIVKGRFDCSYNQLTNLKGAPKEVRKGFVCTNNNLTSLEGATQAVGTYFHCYNNKLTDLKGAPQKVGGLFECSKNQLTSLEGAPPELDGHFACDENKIAYFEDAPKKFKRLKSDFGYFDSFEEIPVSLLYSPRTLARMKEEAEIALDKKCRKAVVLQRNLKVRKPLKL